MWHWRMTDLKFWFDPCVFLALHFHYTTPGAIFTGAGKNTIDYEIITG